MPTHSQRTSDTQPPTTLDTCETGGHLTITAATCRPSGCSGHSPTRAPKNLVWHMQPNTAPEDHQLHNMTGHDPPALPLPSLDNAHPIPHRPPPSQCTHCLSCHALLPSSLDWLRLTTPQVIMAVASLCSALPAGRAVARMSSPSSSCSSSILLSAALVMAPAPPAPPTHTSSVPSTCERHTHARNRNHIQVSRGVFTCNQSGLCDAKLRVVSWVCAACSWTHTPAGAAAGRCCGSRCCCSCSW